MKFFAENNPLTEEEKGKFNEIKKMVWVGLQEKAKSIVQIKNERIMKIPGDLEQEEFDTRSIWHNKRDIDRFVAEKLELNPEKWGRDKAVNIFYKKVANEISKLRKRGLIVDWNYNARAGIWRLKNSINDLEKSFLTDLEKKGLGKTHIQVLEKFHIFKRKIILDSTELRGIRGESPIQPDSMVDKPHYLHNLVRGVYKPAGDDYALSIQTNPNSKWGMEINFDDENWTINYDFEDENKYSADIESLKKCYEKNIPIGVIYKHKKAVNEILGLGKIQNHKGTIFEIVNFMPDETLKIEEKGKKYAISKCEEKDYSCPNLKSSVIRRTKQKWFREILLEEYEHRCAFCNFGIEDYLKSAHIVPFALMQEQDPKNSMNPANGLLLCALCDVAFENGDIIVNEDYQIIGDERLQEKSKIDPTIKSWISNIKDYLEIKISAEFKPDVKFLKWKTELV